METTRVDRWLWGVRLFKSRAAATEACRRGHVRVNDVPAKPAAPVRVGDRVEVVVRGHRRVLEVARLVEKRVGAPIADACLIDHSPPRPPAGQQTPVFDRDRGAGRPTKRDRRQLDRLRRR